RDAFREKLFQLLVKNFGELFETRLRRMQLVVPGAGLRRQRALPVDERDLRQRGKRRQHGRELPQHGPDDLLSGHTRRKLAQVEGRLEPWTQAADTTAIGDGEVVALEDQVGIRAKLVA